MKKLLTALCIFFAVAACKKDEPQLTGVEIKDKIESVKKWYVTEHKLRFGDTTLFWRNNNYNRIWVFENDSARHPNNIYPTDSTKQIVSEKYKMSDFSVLIENISDTANPKKLTIQGDGAIVNYDMLYIGIIGNDTVPKARQSKVTVYLRPLN